MPHRMTTFASKHAQEVCDYDAGNTTKRKATGSARHHRFFENTKNRDTQFEPGDRQHDLQVDRAQEKRLPPKHRKTTLHR